MPYSTDNHSNPCPEYATVSPEDVLKNIVLTCWLLKISYFCSVVAFNFFCLPFLVDISLQLTNVRVTALSSGTEVNVRWDPMSYQPPGMIFAGYRISYR